MQLLRRVLCWFIGHDWREYDTHVIGSRGPVLTHRGEWCRRCFQSRR